MTTPPADRDRTPGRHSGAAAAPPPAAPPPPAPEQRVAQRPPAPVRRIAAPPAAGTLTGRVRTARPAGAPVPAAAPAPASSGPAPALTLDPASAYGSRSAAPATAARPEAEWSATALAAGSAVGTATPAVEAERGTTAAEEARDQPAGEAAPEVRDRPPAPVPTRPRVPRRPWTLGGLHLVQVLVWELALVAVLAVHREPLPVLVPVATVAVLALLLTTVRLSGRWAWQVLAARLRFRGRRRRTDPPGADPVAAADAVLGAVTRGGWIDVVRVDGVDAAVFDHAGGASVVVEASPATTHPFDDRVPVLPALGSLLPAPEDGGPQVTVQLLVQTVPAPGVLGPEDPAAVSYRELTGGSVPARRRSWIALQVQRPPVDTDEEDLRQALVNAVRRVQRQVRRAGLRGHLLGPEDARAGVLTLVGGAPDGTPPGGTRETWRAWHGGDLQHVTLHVARWPDLGDGDAARAWVDRLGEVPALTTTVSVAARRTGDELDLEGTVRLVLPPGDDARAAVTALVEQARALGGTVRRLDGEHAAGVAATLPLGGFLR